MITADYYLYKYLCTCTCARCYYDFMKEMKHRTMCHALTIDILTQSASVNQTKQTKQTEGHENRRLSARPSETGPISQITNSKIHL